MMPVVFVAAAGNAITDSPNRCPLTWLI